MLKLAPDLQADLARGARLRAGPQSWDTVTGRAVVGGDASAEAARAKEGMNYCHAAAR